MQEGLGLPALSEEDKRNILGLNAARLHGIDVDAKRAAIEKDQFGRSENYAPPYSGGDPEAMADFEVDKKYVQAVT